MWSENSKPAPQPNKTKLVWTGILQFVLFGIVGAFVFPLFYIVFTGKPETLQTAIISAVIAMVIYTPLYFRHGVSERKKFLASGGNPTGMNLWMFGAMGTDWKNREASF